MKTNQVWASRLLSGASICALAACGGGGGSGSGSGSSPAPTATTYSAQSLVSDGAVTAAHTDSNLVNPWGIAFEPSGPVWTANNGTQTSTLYDGTGAIEALVVTIPSGTNGDADPTGIVLNTSADFVVKQGAASGAAEFIYDGEGGTISGWSPTTGNAAVITYDDGAGGAVYKGLAIATAAAGNQLYAADFHNNKIDVFDKSFKKITSTGGFKDPTLPAGYAPFNIQTIAGKLYVAYAEQQTPDQHDEVDGIGLGLVDVFDLEGNFVQHLIAAGGKLNAPWGIAIAPPDFGPFSNDLLIGNFGDGKINAYDPASGNSLGVISDVSGAAITIPGLWGIAFGNDNASQPHNTLFFAAGINDEADGVYGRIDLSTGATTGGSTTGGY